MTRPNKRKLSPTKKQAVDALRTLRRYTGLVIHGGPITPKSVAIATALESLSALLFVPDPMLRSKRKKRK